MAVIVWVVEGTWPACVDAVRAHTPRGADVALLHVTTSEVPGVARGSLTGLLGRGHPAREPEARLRASAAEAARETLDAAAARLGRPCSRLDRSGDVEREVLAAANGADLLVLARDGDRSRPGPRSLGPQSRFVVDHAPCPLLLVWPESAPDETVLPPPPPRRP
ncbi:universal stress protein [Streptomyces sp. HSG2]|uniref:universal stress protein n=1 Tax=Streptomyces sp. HSG2 TaxID=2797167 RepID=UPI001907F9AD|nr:universal stress protein [Streptomyces sp. HSG2]